MIQITKQISPKNALRVTFVRDHYLNMIIFSRDSVNSKNNENRSKHTVWLANDKLNNPCNVTRLKATKCESKFWVQPREVPLICKILNVFELFFGFMWRLPKSYALSPNNPLQGWRVWLVWGLETLRKLKLKTVRGGVIGVSASIV